MSITGLSINTRNIDASVRFYTEVVHARVVERSPHHAELDVDGGRLSLRAVGDDAPASKWEPDDLQRGFRHMGFKVASVDETVARAEALGSPVHLAPLEAAGDVRIAFFFDPDGVLVEAVERHLDYDVVVDQAAVDAERALPTPERPRLDHVAVSVADPDATMGRWAEHGSRCAGTLAVPGDPRGLQIHYLHHGPVVLEVFSFSGDTRPAPAYEGAAGFKAVIVDHDDASTTPASDADGLCLTTGPVTA